MTKKLKHPYEAENMHLDRVSHAESSPGLTFLKFNLKIGEI